MSTRGLLQRCCGTCKHFADESCRHPQAKDHHGRFAGFYRYMANPPSVWPKKGFNESCGWWRPNDGATP